MEVVGVNLAKHFIHDRKKPQVRKGVGGGGGDSDSDTGGGGGEDSEKYFRCNTCSYVTNVKARYTKHVKYHTMPLIKCDFCDFKTPYKWNLDRHYKNHNGEGDLHCPLCNFTADIKQSLTVHLQNHHSSYPGHKSLSAMTSVKMNGGAASTSGAPDPSIPFDLSSKEKPSKSSVSSPSPSLIERALGGLLKISGSGLDLSTKSSDSGASGSGKSSDQVSRKRSLSKDDENMIQKSLFLQSLALLPRDDDVGRESSPRTSISLASLSPERRLSTGSTDTGPGQGTSLLKGGGGKKRERKLGLEEISKKLVATHKSDENGSSLLKSVVIGSNSTRCQYCRQRCKTSADLAHHLTVCPEAVRTEDGNSASENGNASLLGRLASVGTSMLLTRGEIHPNGNKDGGDGGRGSDGKIFVWNTLAPEGGQQQRGEEEEDEEDMDDYEDEKGHVLMDVSGGSDDLVGFETSPGIGAIHVGKLEEAEYEGYQGNYLDDEPEDSSVTKTRKVFRCPQPNCGFWATTASRFHVHVVGHYNLKPFECSQCSYKSNWRWDITKHIKLKAIRDPSHSKAKVLLTHESGHRNYRKYDRYLVMMQLKYSADSKLPDCSTVASKRTDVAMELSPSREIVPSPKVSPQPKQGASGNSLPKLTRAPYPSRTSSPSESVKSDESASKQRPPPALVPINGHGPSKQSPGSTMIVQKRMLSGGHVSMPETEIDLSAYGTTFSPITMNLSTMEVDNSSRSIQSENIKDKDGKKVLWKCKKCPFKNATKEVVVFHIRQLHKPKRGESVSILSRNHLTSVPQDEDETIEVKVKSERKGGENKQTGKPNCNFSCNSCSVTVQTKRELIEHAQRHLWEARLNQCEDKTAATTLTISAEETPPRPRSSAAGSHKKYHCIECPYVTDSKGQFLYHKQFHRPRDCPFKCSHCSYTVSHKHLLHQHLRVHGLPPTSVTPPGTSADVDSFSDDQPLNLHASVDLSEAVEESTSRPTVLVWRNGRPLRMYRCRQCPQVFGKLDDLADHEYTHGPTINTIQSPLQPQQNVTISPCSSTDSLTNGMNSQGKVLYCCESCPARFFYEKELEIHSTFHASKSEYQCDLCTYSAKQKSPHLMSHMKVHGVEYQEKTMQLLQRYPKASKLRSKSVPTKVMPSPLIIPQPKISLLTATNLSMKSSSSSEPSMVCKKCPARFQSLQSYQQHITFHGRASNFKCRHCDYSVDSLKNLTLHELLHASTEEASDVPENMIIQSRLLLPQRSSTPMSLEASMDDDRIDNDAFVGNPDFTYPTYIKNGRVKSKRYKCSKCPSAFEKRDQYKVHMGLHGSDQRYKCPVCDYAVTYYANFIQHLKKHSTQPEVPPELLIAKPLSKIKQEELAASRPAVLKAALTADRPTTVVKEALAPKKSAFNWKCDLCPFSTDETKARDEHRKRHIRQAVKGTENSHTCSFCDYTVPTKALLKEHVRLHFQVPVESLQSYLFANDVDIYVNGNYEEKIYSEKENYDDHEDDGEEDDDDASYVSSHHENQVETKDKAKTLPTITYVDMASKLPITMIEDASDEEVVNGHLSTQPEPMDCSS